MNDISVFPVRAFQDNYVWTLRQGNHAAVVDPGDARPVLAYLRAQKLTLTAILNTHHHADHVGGNAELLVDYPVPVYGPYDERIPTVTRRVREGDRFTLQEFGIEFRGVRDPGTHPKPHRVLRRRHALSAATRCSPAAAAACSKARRRKCTRRSPSSRNCPRQRASIAATNTRWPTSSSAKPSKRATPNLPAWEQAASALRAKDEPTLPSTLAQEKLANPFLRCDEPAVIAAASKHAGKPLNDPVSVLGAIREWKNNF